MTHPSYSSRKEFKYIIMILFIPSVYLYDGQQQNLLILSCRFGSTCFDGRLPWWKGGSCASLIRMWRPCSDALSLSLSLNPPEAWLRRGMGSSTVAEAQAVDCQVSPLEVTALACLRVFLLTASDVHEHNVSGVTRWCLRITEYVVTMLFYVFMYICVTWTRGLAICDTYREL